MSRFDRSTEPLSWESEFSLLTDRFVMYDGFKVVAWTYGLMALLFTVIFLAQGEPEDILPLLGMLGLTMLFLTALGGAIMLAVFRNRFQVRNTISDDGVLVESISRPGRFFNRLAVVAGGLARSPGTAGAGLVAMSGEQVGLEWIDLHRINAHDEQRVLSLMNSWRVVLRLYCTPENYGSVRARVEEGMARGARLREEEARLAGPSPLPRLAKISALIFLAGALSAPAPFDISPWPVLAAVGALLVSVWLPAFSRFAGLVSLIAVGVAVTALLLQGFAVHQLIPDEVLAGREAPSWSRYSGWSTLDKGEWLRLALAGSGLALLAFGAFAAMLGRFDPRVRHA